MNYTKTSKTETKLTWSPLQLHVPRTASVTILCSGFIIIIVQASSVEDLIQNLHNHHTHLEHFPPFPFHSVTAEIHSQPQPQPQLSCRHSPTVTVSHAATPKLQYVSL